MPYKADRLCNIPNCNNIALPFAPCCIQHKREKESIINSRRDKQRNKFYKNSYWQNARAMFLRSNPECNICNRPANEIDHIKEWNTWEEFIDDTNWQALCKSCHSRKTAREMKENGKWG